MKRLTLLVLLLLGSWSPAWAHGCSYYASPEGGGNGLSEDSPFMIRDFFATAHPGTTLCLLDGTYRGAASMIDLTTASGLSGVEGNPISVRALNDGAVTIDGQFARVPVRLNNNWWVIEGINAKHSSGEAIRVSGYHNILRRIVAWDAHFAKGNPVVLMYAGSHLLLEDVAAFGGGRRAFGIQNVANVTCRRCWGSWGGSITIGPKTGMTMGYNSYNVICENCLMTWSAESMPEEYTLTDPKGNPSTRFPRLDGRYVNFRVTSGVQPYGEDNVGSGPNGICMNQTILGSLSYLKAGVRYGRPHSGPAGDQSTMISQGVGINHQCSVIRHTMAYISPSHANFSIIRGFVGGSSGGTANNTTSVRGTPDSWHSSWIRSAQAEGTSVAAAGAVPVAGQVPSPWTATGAGANLCKRWVNGVVTDLPLWPWPMNERIKEATASAGFYGQGYADSVIGCGAGQGNCVGGRATRTATDVTADVESLLGPIPAQCRND